MKGLIMRMLAVVMLGLVCLTGCSKSYHPDVWVANWDDAKTLPGVNSASVEVFDFDQGGPNTSRFIVWSDLPTSKASISSSPLGTKYLSDHAAPDGKKLHVESSSGDLTAGGDGIVKVGSQPVSLSAGRVILISTQGDQPEILQLDLPADSELWKIVGQSGTDSDPQTELSLFAKSTPKILEFFRKHSKQAAPAADVQPTN